MADDNQIGVTNIQLFRGSLRCQYYMLIQSDCRAHALLKLCQQRLQLNQLIPIFMGLLKLVQPSHLAIMTSTRICKSCNFSQRQQVKQSHFSSLQPRNVPDGLRTGLEASTKNSSDYYFNSWIRVWCFGLGRNRLCVLWRGGCQFSRTNFTVLSWRHNLLLCPVTNYAYYEFHLA